jgi:hypothetical protein
MSTIVKCSCISLDSGGPRKDIEFHSLLDTLYFCQTPHHELTTNQLAILFELNHRTVRKNLFRGPQDAQVPGRHRALNEMLEPKLTIMIIQAFKERKVMTKRHLLELVGERYSAGLTKGWLNVFLGRRLDALQISRSLPQEDLHLTVPREHLSEMWPKVMSTHVQKGNEFCDTIVC